MPDDAPMGSRTDRPVLVYDGDCGFCRLWIDRWREATGESVEYLAQQDPECARRFPGLDPVALQESVHRVAVDGGVTRGAEAVLRTLEQARGWGWLARAWLRAPVLLAGAEWAYRGVARYRWFFSRVTRWLWGDSVRRPQWQVARDVFLVGLAAIHLVAFVSLWVQVDGLIGSRGILPASDFMDQMKALVVERDLGWERYRVLPTLGWLGTGDRLLHGFCLAGVLLAVLAGSGYARAPALFGLWLLYLSLSVLGQEFLSFQWDTLLLETTFLAVFLAPWSMGRRRARASPTSRWARALLVWLLFRLMLESGVVKLASGDPSWRSLTALEFHYWTQPLPGPWSWHVHHLPAGCHRVCCAVMFGIELVLPWMLWAPRRLRLVACFGLAGLQVAILATGNYTFFNLLSLLLCVLLVDDALWRRWLRRSLDLGGSDGREPPPRGEIWRRTVLPAVAAISLFVGAAPIVGWLIPGGTWPSAGLERWLAPLRTFNDYGLFAVMTTSRSEIEVEGSVDGVTWRPYVFRHKPGEAMRRPGQVAPHQPRLDWQMWFAALGDVRQNPWFVRFAIRLLEGSPEVLALLGNNPFPEGPPKWVRARLFRYRFSTPEEREHSGAWWVREPQGDYCPPLSLRAEAG